MNMLLFKTVLVLSCVLGQYLVQSAQVFDVLKYGAKADGTHKNTAEIAKAIEAASAAGGGTVHFPKGTYLTGPIHFRSNVTLNLDEGVVIKFSDHFDDYYPMVKVRWEGTELINFSPLIYGINVSHVGITSVNATLDGSGEKWWHFYNHLRSEHKKTGHWNTNGSTYQIEWHKANAEMLKHKHELLDDPGQFSHGFLRPQFFHPIYSDHITLEGINFVNSPFWNVHPTFSDHITINRVRVTAPSNAPNTDGIDPDSCRFVTISNCFVSVGDDCVCVKSGKDKQGRMINRPSENITVSNCEMHSGHGGFVIGSEMSGSVRNIIAHNLTFSGTDRGIRIKAARGRGGVVENVHIYDVTMKNISHEGITINTFYVKDSFVAPAENVSERTPFFHAILVENVKGEAKLGIQVLGLPEKHINDIELRNVHMVAAEPVLVKDADNVRQINVTNVVDKHAFSKHPAESPTLEF